MPNQISEINVDNQNYNMVGAVAKGTCSSAATDWNKVVILEAGCSVAQDMMLQVKFDHGCTVGDSQRKTIYSSDQVNYYSDSAMTVPVTLAPEANRTITYTGSGSAYYYITFPTISVTGTDIQNKPICDSRGHTAGTGCFNDGDKMLFRYDGECCMIQNSDVRQKSSDYTTYADGRIDYPLKESIKLYGNITITNNNYYQLATGVAAGHRIVGYAVNNWQDNSDVFSIIIYKQTQAYLIAKPGTIVYDLGVTWFYE